MINSISQQLRILPADIRPAVAADPEEGGFGETLQNAMDQVDQLQASAQDQVSKILSGNGVDVHDAMIAVEKADLSFQLMMQVRNKIVSAYQEVSRMQF